MISIVKKFILLLIFLFLSIPMVFAKENINVAVNIDNKYTTYALLTFNSILKNNKSDSDYTFYVLNDGLSLINKLRITWFVKKHKQKVEFVYVDLPNILNKNHQIFKNSSAEHITNIGMSRIFIPDLLPESVQKCIYIDCDTLVLKDLKELWDTDISKYAVAMCKDSNRDHLTKMVTEIEDYYNSGVILMNLNYMRHINATEKMLKCLKYNILNFPDQDALNIILNTHIKTLNSKWDYMYISVFDEQMFPNAKKGIIHYICKDKPWHFLDTADKPYLIRLYYSYWKNSDMKFSYYLNSCKLALSTHYWSNMCKNNFTSYKYNFDCFRAKIYRTLTKNRTPKVSVIIPVYNGGKYIDNALQCLKKQTFKNYEIIMVDDGSTDSTAFMLYQNKMLNPKIKVLTHTKNLGAGTARNTGLVAARGDYVIFLDIDDEYNKNLLKKMYRKAKETDSDIVVSNINYNFKELSFLTNKDVFNYKDLPDHIFLGIRSCVWDKMYKRDFLLKNNLAFNRLRHGEDVYFVNRSVILADKITSIHDILVNYKDNENSLSHQVWKHPSDSVEAWLLTKKFLEEKGIYKDVEQSYIFGLLNSFVWTYYRLENPNVLIKKYKPIFQKMEIFDKELTYYFNIYDYILVKELMGIGNKKSRKLENYLYYKP